MNFTPVMLRWLGSKHVPWAALTMGTGVVMVAAAPRLFAPYDPTRIDIVHRLAPPLGWGGNAAHLLGTDQLGRDVLSRLIYGAQVSVAVGLAGALGAAAIGLLLGMSAGYFGGSCDAAVMRVAELILSIPVMLLALGVIGALGPSLGHLLLVLVLVSWARYARLVRAEVMRLRGRAFVELARVAGCGAIRIITVHILPNVLNPTLVLLALDIGRLIVLEASLSFLGVGVQPPAPSWGLMMASGREYLRTAWWLATMPGLAVLLTCLAANRMGDWMRDRLDPHRRAD